MNYLLVLSCVVVACLAGVIEGDNRDDCVPKKLIDIFSNLANGADSLTEKEKKFLDKYVNGKSSHSGASSSSHSSDSGDEDGEKGGKGNGNKGKRSGGNKCRCDKPAKIVAYNAKDKPVYTYVRCPDCTNGKPKVDSDFCIKYPEAVECRLQGKIDDKYPGAVRMEFYSCCVSEASPAEAPAPLEAIQSTVTPSPTTQPSPTTTSFTTLGFDVNQ